MKITICGSVAFYDQMQKTKAALEEMGHQVKLPPVEIENDKGEMIPVQQYYQIRKASTTEEGWVWQRKKEAIKMHFDKVAWAEAVLVLNYDKNNIAGYVGSNTLMEIAVAFYLQKPIYLLKPIPEMACREEIIGIGPTILNGDLTKLNLSTNQKKGCDNKSVGILVWQNDKLLLIERKKFPFGFAPPAGHVDEHGSFEQAVQNELKEEVGLDVIDLKLIKEGRKENPCRRGSTWHYWKIYQAETKGEVKPSQEETKQVGWYSRDDLKRLAERTENYLAGAIKEDEWQKQPGLEPVWYDWLKEMTIIERIKK